MMNITTKEETRVEIINMIDEELVNEGFKYGLDYDAEETFSDECLEALWMVKKILIHKHPSLKEDIKKVIWEIECDITDAIEEEWF